MKQSRVRRAAALLATVLVVASANGCGRRGADEHGRVAPHFEPGFNLFSAEQDVEIGRQSAAEVVRQLPALSEPTVEAYVRELGGRLASRAPGEKFPYEFHVLDVKEVNAFALPGGIVFVNRGTLETVRDEGELAGVMAHEICHVALRHGTNQMSKAYVAQAGLDILSRIFGGGDQGASNLGEIVAAVGGLGLNTLFLKFGRTAETQADLTGAQVMAGAGYDPVEMVHFFDTLEEEGGQRVPAFLSDHPDPGDRARAIEQVRESIRIESGRTDAGAFERMRGALKALPPASSTKAQAVGPSGGGGERPEPPSGDLQQYAAPTNSYEVSYPSNWDALSDKADQAAFSPRGGYGKLRDDLVFTHGVLVGVVDAGTTDLAEATRAFVEQQLRANPDFEIARGSSQVTVGGRPGLGTPLAGPSPVTGRLEVDVVYTTMLADGRMFYAITVAPQDEAAGYQAAFERVLESIRLAA